MGLATHDVVLCHEDFDGDGYTADAVELGRIKADRGNQNYRVPGGADVASARSVVIWCKQFGVLFATARLS
jgi:hypothetical protein